MRGALRTLSGGLGGPADIGTDQNIDIAFGHRFVEQEPLPPFTADPAQQFGFGLHLDALRHRRIAKVSTQMDQRTDDRLVGRRARQILDKGLVDLQDVERQAFEVGQRGVTRAEIVERDRDAGFPQMPELIRHRRRGMADDRSFR